VAARRGEGVLRATRRAAEGAADRGEDGRQKDVSCYTIKDKDTFVDFCVGPHVPSTGKLKAFKLLSHVERVLVKGDARNAPMPAHLRHRVLSDKEPEGSTPRANRRKRRSAITASSGAELGLLFTSTRGHRARVLASQGDEVFNNTLANYMRDVLFPAGYVEVKTPSQSTTRRCGSESGHWKHYQPNMFLIESEGETMSVKR
jgi:threonyl-tRNA synthetase